MHSFATHGYPTNDMHTVRAYPQPPPPLLPIYNNGSI